MYIAALRIMRSDRTNARPPHDTRAAREPSTQLTRYAFYVVVGAFLAIALWFLVTEHRAHLFGALPFALILACPLLHLLMHRGHRHEH